MIVPLNYGWKYVPEYKKEFLSSFPSVHEIVDIPHINRILPFSYFEDKYTQFTSSYEKEFEIPQIDGQKRYLLVFEGFSTQADIHVNGFFVGHYISGYYEIQVDVTDFVKTGNNRLLVILDSSFDKNIPPFGGQFDYYPPGGIYREVRLEIRPRIFLNNIRITGLMTGKLVIDKTIHNQDAGKYEVSYELYYHDKIIAFFNEDHAEIGKVNPWDLDSPELYKLNVKVTSAYGEDVSSHFFGFRDVKFTKEGFFLNGKHIVLRGLNRHQAYPYVGYAMPKSGQELDADILKNELAVNIVRSSHYPPSRHFLSRCDEIGLLAFIEIPGWQHIGPDDSWQALYRQNVRNMIKEHFNHPSVIMWGVRINESHDNHDLYAWANTEARLMDPYRPTGGVRYLKNSEFLEDVYTYNDFVHDGTGKGVENPDKVYKKKVPYMITEYNGHMYPTKSYDDTDHRISQALRHFRVLNDSLKYPRISGVIGWVMNDYNTASSFGSGDHVCHHGVLDSFRQKKWAAYSYLSQTDGKPVMQVLSPLALGDNREAIRGDVYVASNVDYIELYMNGKYINRYYPDRKHYKYLKHPPFYIDDFIGDKIYGDIFSKRDADYIKHIMNLGAGKGLKGIPFYKYIKVGLLMLKYRIRYKDLMDLWFKYVNHWGNEGNSYSFVGFIDNAEVIRRNISDNAAYSLKAETSKPVLTPGDTYDVMSVSVRLTDQNGNIGYYANIALKAETAGGIEVLGPSLFTLQGGQTCVYVRSKNKGKGTLTITTENYDPLTVSVEVR